ncbi:hypothetical protein BGZ51_001384 [Haplosporangium sp. Z 767]|nr:hypothetical protein BGZ50_000664 [Haplosporangium sp. Z 11]KAF9194040.1 hypothetical protein BGZ51_001384 [Haplosporangium sp. Z 767]
MASDFSLYVTIIQLGIRRHKYHIPWNTAMFLVAMVGYFFGYGHHMFGIGKGTHEDHDGDENDHLSGNMPGMGMDDIAKRQAGDTSAEHYGWTWKTSAHGALANLLLLLLFVQVGMGVYRKLTKARPRLQLVWLSNALPRKIHSYLGKAHLVLAYIQIVLGCIKLIEACPGQAFGQCISHIVMGGSFWWYGGIYIAYLVGSFPGVTRPEWYESLVMTIWGVINFSILHQWGTRWSHSDLQHTSLGLLWVGGGTLSLFLESKYSPLAQFIIRKNPIPALLIILTGYAMGQHSQYYMFATRVHTFFGYCLMLGGIARLIQLALRPPVSPMSVSSNTNSVEDDEDDATLEDEDLQDKSKNRHSGNRTGDVEGIAKGETPVSAFFGFLSALGLISAGLLFQSAHEEQLNLMMYYLSDASTYVNWVMAFAFFTCTYILMITQVGKKQIGGDDAGANNKAYNRIRTRVDSEDHGRHLNRNDIEMSGFLETDD